MVRSWLTDGVLVCSGEEAVPAKKTKTVISASEISQTRQTRLEKVGGLDMVPDTRRGPRYSTWPWGRVVVPGTQCGPGDSMWSQGLKVALGNPLGT